MPSSARKSSVGAARRGIQKAHIPYRGDNPEVGKKTGIVVRPVQRMSDGFEPFEELLQQADKRTPPKPKHRKKSVPVAQQQDFDDEDGEMSMDIDDSPVRYLSSARIPSTPASRNTSTSSRPVARTSEVDFDDIPSPRSRGSTSRLAKAGPSNLSKSMTAKDIFPDSDSDNEPDDYANGMDNGGDYGMLDEESPGRQQSSPRRKSFSQMNQSTDGVEENYEDDEPVEEPPQSSPRLDKGKRKERLEDIQEEEEEVHHDMNGFEQEDSDEQEPEPSPPPNKKQKVLKDEHEKKKTRTASKKENRVYREGSRRSKREHFRPLEWWRGEKVVYGRTHSSGPVLVPAIKEIRRIPLEPPLPLASRKRGSTRARSKSKAAEEKVIATAINNPEEGWDDDTEAFGEVFDVDKQMPGRRRLAWTAKMVTLTQAGNNQWLFEKVFGDGDFIAAGQLVIPPDCRKPTKATKDNTYIFYVIEGAVNFKVQEVSKIVATGGMFIAPRGNTYFIENISTRAAKLFFTQARKVPKEDHEPPTNVTSSAHSRDRRVTEVVRSSSPRQPPASTSREGGRAAQSLPPGPQNRQPGGKRAPSARI